MILQIRHHCFICKIYYVLKSQSHDPDTPNYMEALSGENTDEYFKAVDDEIQSLMRRDTWDIVSRKSVSYHNVLPETCSFKCKRNPDKKSGNSRHDIV